MSEWDHEYIGNNGQKHLRVCGFPSRAWAFASADKDLIGVQSAYDEGKGDQCEIPFRPKSVRTIRQEDGWCYGSTDGDIFKMQPDGPEPNSK